MGMGGVIDYSQSDQQIENKLWMKEELGELNKDEEALLEKLKNDRDAFEAETQMRRERALGQKNGPNVLERQRELYDDEEQGTGDTKGKKGGLKAPYGLKWIQNLIN